MAELEQELAELGTVVDWTEADVSAAVGTRLRADRRPDISPMRARRWPVLIGAAAALVAAVALLTLRVRDDRSEDASVPPPTTAASPSTSAAAELDLGPTVSIADVRMQVGFTMPVPREPGFEQPDEVHVSHPPATGEATLVYRARQDLPAAANGGIGMLISAFRGDIDSALFASAGRPTDVVTVQGRRGYWVEGAPHEFAYRDSSGTTVMHPLRTTANVLLWEVNGITVRIESALPRDDVIRVANAMA